jgi:hypothetical protein
MTSPLGNVYGNFTKTHDFSHDQMMQLMSNWINVPLEEVRLQLEEGQSDNVSMSWHLTALEKRTIEGAVFRADNQKALERIKQILK